MQESAWTVLYQSHMLAGYLLAPDLSRLSSCSHECLSVWPQVQHLQISYYSSLVQAKDKRSRAAADGFRRSCQVGHLSRLVTLSLVGSKLKDTDVQRLATDILPALPNLKALNLSENPALGVETLRQLACSPLSELRTLSLAHNSNMGREIEGGRALAALLDYLSPHLECLDARGLGMTQVSLEAFLLETSTQRQEQYDSPGRIGAVPACRGLSGLLDLRLARNLFQERGATLLARTLLAGAINSSSRNGEDSGSTSDMNENHGNCKGRSSLRRLDLSDCYVGEEGLQVFADMIYRSRLYGALQILDLSNNRCHAPAAWALGRACIEGLPLLEVLRLQMNLMGDGGASAFVSGVVGDRPGVKEGAADQVEEEGRPTVRRIPCLKELNLSHNMMGPEAVEQTLHVFLSASRCPALRYLDVSHNAVPEAEVMNVLGRVEGHRKGLHFEKDACTRSTETANPDVSVILAPPSLYCQVVLENGKEDEEEEAEGEEGEKEREKEKEDKNLITFESVVLNWTTESFLSMAYFVCACI